MVLPLKVHNYENIINGMIMMMIIMMIMMIMMMIIMMIIIMIMMMMMIVLNEASFKNAGQSTATNVFFYVFF